MHVTVTNSRKNPNTKTLKIIAKVELEKLLFKVEYAATGYGKLNEKSLEKPHYSTHFQSLDRIDIFGSIL